MKNSNIKEKLELEQQQNFASAVSVIVFIVMVTFLVSGLRGRTVVNNSDFNMEKTTTKVSQANIIARI